MKSDIDFPKVKQVGVCASREEKEGIVAWRVHVINLLPTQITNVLVSTRGYGMKGKEKVETSQLRHFFEQIDSQGSKPIEMIPDELVGLNNQYWVSYYVDGVIYDKKFIFLPDTLLEENQIDVPVLKGRGVLIL